MDACLLLELLLNPCGMLAVGAVMYIAGTWASIGKEGLRRFGAGLAGLVLIGVMAFGIDRRIDLTSLAVGAAGIGLFVLGALWIVLAVFSSIFSALATAMTPPPREPERDLFIPDQEPVPVEPPPPPPSMEERTQHIRQEYDQECKAIRALGLDADEEKIALDQARQRLMRRLRKLLP